MIVVIVVVFEFVLGLALTELVFGDDPALGHQPHRPVHRGVSHARMQHSGLLEDIDQGEMLVIAFEERLSNRATLPGELQPL